MAEIEVRIRRISSLWDHIRTGDTDDLGARWRVQIHGEDNVAVLSESRSGSLVATTVPSLLQDGRPFWYSIARIDDALPTFRAACSVQKGVVRRQRGQQWFAFDRIELFHVDDALESRQQLVARALASDAYALVEATEVAAVNLWDQPFWLEETTAMAHSLPRSGRVASLAISDDGVAGELQVPRRRSRRTVPVRLGFEHRGPFEWDPFWVHARAAERTEVRNGLIDWYARLRSELPIADSAALGATYQSLLDNYLGGRGYDGIHPTPSNRIAETVTTEVRHPMLRTRTFATARCYRPLRRITFYKYVD